MAFRIYSNISDATYKCTADIANYDTKTRQAIRSAVETGVNAIADKAIQLAPAGPPKSAREITIKAGIKREMSKYGASGTIKSTAPHSHLVEFGTGPRITYNNPKKSHKRAMIINGGFVRGMIANGRMPKRPFMRPAVESERPKIEEDVRRAIEP